MKLTVIRQIVGERGIAGELFLDGRRECFTVENREKAIPEGIFPIVLEYSRRFGRLLPEIKNIPERTECKFHVANFAYQLEGCIAVGRVRGSDAVLESALALNALMEKLIIVRNRHEEITVEIKKEAQS